MKKKTEREKKTQKEEADPTTSETLPTPLVLQVGLQIYVAWGRAKGIGYPSLFR